MILHSTFTKNPTQDFQGYCFIGADYVYGPQGAERRHDETGQSVGPGNDGCYVTIRFIRGGWEFGVDALGMARLFYYQSEGVWAVSSSISTLVDHLRSNGIRLRPNFAQLAAFGARGPLTAQMTSFRTVFEGIQLVPSSSVAFLRDGRIEIALRQEEPELLPASYAEGLSTFLELWMSRVAGLLADGRAQLECDLSGGIDSRTVFAFVRAAASLVEGSEDRIAFRSNKNQPGDFIAASAIAAEYGIELNPSVEDRAGGNLRNGRTPVSWRDACMGNYLLTYFYGMGSHPFAMHCHGAGGEIYRNVHASGPEELANTKKKDIPAHLYGVWREDFLETVEQLAIQVPGMNPLQAHYREFRNRFHFGHRPHSSVVLSMLNSTALSFIADYPEVVENRQLYFDVMESLLPGLAYMPYDKESKAPTAANTSSLTAMPILKSINPGRVYAEDEWESGMTHNGTIFGFSDFMAEAKTAVEDARVQSFVSPEVLSNASVALNYGIANRRFSHPNAIETKDLVYCVTARWVLDESVMVRQDFPTSDQAGSDGGVKPLSSDDAETDSKRIVSEPNAGLFAGNRG